MTNKPYGIVASLIGICLSVLPAQMMASAPAMAQSTTAALQRPPLMDREKEIALALSACPPSLASKAAVYVLEEAGYVKVRESENGFTAIVGHSLPTAQDPQCMDAEGTRTVLLRILKIAELRAQGKSPEEIKRLVADALAKGELSAPTRPGVNYMLSTENVVTLDPAKGTIGPFPPHVMFYAPNLTNADIGAQNLAWPAFVGGAGTPYAVLIVPVLEQAQAGPGHEHR